MQNICTEQTVRILNNGLVFLMFPFALSSTIVQHGTVRDTVIKTYHFFFFALS